MSDNNKNNTNINKEFNYVEAQKWLKQCHEYTFSNIANIVNDYIDANTSTDSSIKKVKLTQFIRALKYDLLPSKFDEMEAQLNSILNTHLSPLKPNDSSEKYTLEINTGYINENKNLETLNSIKTKIDTAQLRELEASNLTIANKVSKKQGLQQIPNSKDTTYDIRKLTQLYYDLDSYRKYMGFMLKKMDEHYGSQNPLSTEKAIELQSLYQQNIQVVEQINKMLENQNNQDITKVRVQDLLSSAFSKIEFLEKKVKQNATATKKRKVYKKTVKRKIKKNNLGNHIGGHLKQKENKVKQESIFKEGKKPSKSSKNKTPKDFSIFDGNDVKTAEQINKDLEKDNKTKKSKAKKKPIKKQNTNQQQITDDIIMIGSFGIDNDNTNPTGHIDLSKVKAYIDFLNQQKDTVAEVVNQCETVNTKAKKLDDYLTEKNKKGYIFTKSDKRAMEALEKNVDNNVNRIKKLNRNAETNLEKLKIIENDLANIASDESVMIDGKTYQAESKEFKALSNALKTHEFTQKQVIKTAEQAINQLRSDLDKIKKLEKNNTENVDVTYDSKGNITTRKFQKESVKKSSAGVEYTQKQAYSEIKTSELKKQANTKLVIKSLGIKLPKKIVTLSQVLAAENMRNDTIDIVLSSEQNMLMLIAAAKSIGIESGRLNIKMKSYDDNNNQIQTPFDKNSIEEFYQKMSTHDKNNAKTDNEIMKLFPNCNIYNLQDLYKGTKVIVGKYHLNEDRKQKSAMKAEHLKNKKNDLYANTLLAKHSDMFAKLEKSAQHTHDIVKDEIRKRPSGPR